MRAASRSQSRKEASHNAPQLIRYKAPTNARGVNGPMRARRGREAHDPDGVVADKPVAARGPSRRA
eukprot:225286-Lingulodinium_polyedra.AAC.1